MRENVDFVDTKRLASESGAFPECRNVGLGQYMHQEQNSLCRVKVIMETVVDVSVEAAGFAGRSGVCQVCFFGVAYGT